MSSTYTVTVDIDVANQTVTASDSSITVPTSNYDIVTFDNKSCIRANNGDGATFTFGENIESFTCKIFLQSVVDFTLFAGGDTNSTRYSLVYYPNGYWYNPDYANFDPNNELVGVWVTVTYSNTNRTLTFDNGTTQFTRSINGYLINFSIACYDNRYNVYLTDFRFDVTIPESKYLNGTGLAEVWTNTKNYISAQLLGYIPKSGTSALSGSIIPDTDNSYDLGDSTYGFKDIYTNKMYLKGSTIFKLVDDSFICLGGATAQANGANLVLNGKSRSTSTGEFKLEARNGTNTQQLIGRPNGTLIWNGQAVQTTSDQRLKQQIAEIDDDLLTAWEDVEPVQFKYNDAVKEKSDNARLHTGYVVQQIDEACKKHNVDVSKYGLYCHEEYAEETREVEQADGTKKTEVVRPANEHYSLRYTEALIVECAYLRKKLKELTARIEQLEKGNNVK